MSDDLLVELRRTLNDFTVPEKAPQMAAYMKDRFAFLGVNATARRAAQRQFVNESASWSSATLFAVADACWAEPEREFQYVACDLLVRRVGSIAASDIGRVEALIRSKSWWDTVDALAANVVGPMVAADSQLTDVMDRWIEEDDIWIARTAILHQLKYKERTDRDRLFAYVDRRAGDREFFLRKASGWALREYAKTEPGAVRGYVSSRGDRLSGLTRREALKHIGP